MYRRLHPEDKKMTTLYAMPDADVDNRMSLVESVGFFQQ